MNIDSYLKRIKCEREVTLDEKGLVLLHERHIQNVPFENLDICFKRPFSLNLERIYTKVVEHKRGRFCYELNGLFNALLCELGFKSSLIEARIYDENGDIGPRLDHMAICVKLGKSYLLDVGYGDLFVRPLEIKEGIQYDGRNKFRLAFGNDEQIVLWMQSASGGFVEKYAFNLNQVEMEDFLAIFEDKRTNPNSYFVKNTVCTKPTEFGRITVFNDKFIVKKGTEKLEKEIANELELKEVLKVNFDIVMA